MVKNKEIAIYKSKDGEVQLEVKLDQETVWLTQKQISDLFKTTPQNITMHIKTIYADKELKKGATCKNLLQVQSVNFNLKIPSLVNFFCQCYC